MKFERDMLLQSALFAPLHAVITNLKADHFPTLDELNALLSSRRIALQSGCELRFVEPQAGRLAFEEQYEPRCYLTGEVQTRANNRHDLFNALVWLTFPKAKAAINARHYRALMLADGVSGRGGMRDTNTLIDESGVIVAYSDEDLADLLMNFQWRELFWQHREQVRNSHFDKLRTGMNFYIFGHGLYEKAMQPYVGMTGHGLLVRVGQEFFSWPDDEQLAHLDDRAARILADHCVSTRELSPIPLLGVPGWTADNEQESYYDNTAYFRPGRRKPAG
jgi:hypothetical protein